MVQCVDWIRFFFAGKSQKKINRKKNMGILMHTTLRPY